MHEILKTAYELSARGEPFVVATVVWAGRPTSAKPGAKALIRSDGTVSGWVGGSCAQPVVVQEALHALRDGRPRLLRLGELIGERAREGVRAYAMSCQSGGSLEIYMEPVLPRAELLIVGQTPVAQALCRLAGVLDVTVTVVAPVAGLERFPDADGIVDPSSLSSVKVTAHTYVVVATQGEDDEEALGHSLAVDVPYIAFVGSRNKARGLMPSLQARGIPVERLARLRTPAGLDIGATTPEEIAVSILAEIIQVRRRAVPAPAQDPVPSKTTKDPVCAMTVDPATARWKAEHAGKSFWFCGQGCRDRFQTAPAQYVTVDPHAPE